MIATSTTPMGAVLDMKVFLTLVFLTFDIWNLSPRSHGGIAALIST